MRSVRTKTLHACTKKNTYTTRTVPVVVESVALEAVVVTFVVVIVVGVVAGVVGVAR